MHLNGVPSDGIYFHGSPPFKSITPSGYIFRYLQQALTKAADDGLLTSGFFWIPSLGGPTTLAMRQEVRPARGSAP
jgi:hypothetical protein